MASYEKNKSSGLWSVRFRVTLPDGSTKQPRLSGYKTKKEAQYAYEDYLTEEKEKAALPALIEEPKPAELTFSELVSHYFNYEKTRVKASSYYDLTKKIESKILPFFENIEVKSITPAVILKWQNTLEAYSYRYKKDIQTHLSSIYNFAERYYDIPNVMKKVDRPRNLEGKKEMLFYSPDEFSRFIKEVSRPDYRMFFTFLYLSGCRRGEALALTWKDITEEPYLTATISRSVAYKVGENGKPYTVTDTKTHKSRTVALPSFLTAELIAYKQWQSENVKNLKGDGTDFVFGGEDPLPPTSIERALTNSAKAAGVKRIRVHDLRHSCASYLIHKGVSIVAVSAHLGHSSTQMTFDTYSHMLPDDRQVIRNNLEDLSSIL